MTAGMIDPQYVAQMEHLAAVNGKKWASEREIRERRDAAILAIKTQVDGAETLEFHQLRKVLDNIRRICEVELRMPR